VTASPLALIFAFGTALAWSGLDATRKALTQHLAPAPLVVLLTFGQAPVFAAWASLGPGWALDGGYLVPGLLCLGLNVLANLAFVWAVKLSPLSLTVPFLSFTPVFTTVLAVPLVGERPSALQLAGIALVVVGALLLHGGGDRRGLLAMGRAMKAERGSMLMVGVALMWSLTAVLDKLALDHAALPAHALVQTGGVGIVLGLWLAARRRASELTRLRRGLRAYVAAVVFGAAAIGLQLQAIQLTFVALVETVKRAVGMTMSVVLGRAVFEEELSGHKIAAVLLMAAGTAAVTLA
jgi:drug/metabolite transporter (DMT)-like permease